MGMDTAMDTAMGKKPPTKHMPIRSTAVMLGVALTAPLVAAQSTEKGVEPKPSIKVAPRVTVTETWTDNVRLNGTGQTELITEVSPGLHVDFNKARLKGFLDYSLSGIAYANSTAANRTVNVMSSNLQLEAVDGTLFVDASGSISQQAASAFGAQLVDNTSVNSNRTEVSTYRISPFVKGHLGDAATYSARYSRSTTSSGAIGASDSATSEMILGLKGDFGAKRLGWTADIRNQEVSYSVGRTTENGTALLGLTFAITPRFNVTAESGIDSNNFTGQNRESSTASGAGLTWTPLASTKLSAILLKHSYGDTYKLDFDHRTARTVWNFSDSKMVTQSPNSQGTGSSGTAYDLYYAQFAATEPDPVARAQLVSSYLQTYGISPGSVVSTGFTSASVALEHRQQLSFALLGKRSTITFIASQSESTRLDAVTTAIDDFTKSPTVRQQGLSGNFAHRLSPDYSLSLLLSHIETVGALSAQSTSLRSMNLTLTGKIGKKTTAAIGLRKVNTESSATPFSESAVTARVNLQL